MKGSCIVVLLGIVLFMQGCMSQSKIADQADESKPNIVLIYADDLGIGLLEHEGQQIIKTPHIDKLANQGMRFQNAYSNMLCAPARASLISGRHDCHADGFKITSGSLYRKPNVTQDSLNAIADKIDAALPQVAENQVFLGQVAQSEGYTTGQIGKLEWGFTATDKQMKRHGWDYYYGYLDHVRAHGFYPPFLFENGKMVEIEGNTLVNCGKSKEPENPKIFEERHNMTGKKQYSANLFIDKALDFITDNKDNPFLLYFPTQLPHGPVSIPEIHPDFINDDRLTEIEKEYASMVKLLDDHVGLIMTKLEELNLAENTIVIFTADNGHEIYYSKKGRILKPYRNIKTRARFDGLDNKYYSHLSGDIFDGNGGRAGLKRSNLQGGIQVPLIFHWPKKIQPKTVSNQLVANYDIVSTLAQATGFSKPLTTDGVSFYNTLLGNESEQEHDFVVYQSFTGPALITNDGWKIRTHLKKNAFEIFYLPEDFKEENNLSETKPEKFEMLKSMLVEACEGDLNNGLFFAKTSITKVKM